MYARGIPERASRTTGDDVVRLLLAGIILAAAALKGYQLATEPMLGRTLLDCRWFLIGVVEFEWFFGLWLLLGAARRLTWLAALACFSGFACVSAYKGLLGEASCGCFGKVEVNPWYTGALDVVCVALLLMFRPTGTQAEVGCSPRAAALRCSLIGLVIGIPTGFAMVSYQAGSLSAEGMIAGDGDLVVLEPEKWIGKPFPLVDHIDVGRQLTKGKWLIVLYHLGCPECEKLITEYRQRSSTGDIDPAACPVVLIEVHEPEEEGAKLDVSGLNCLLGRLRDSREWFVSSPAVLLLEDGLVRQAYEGEAEQFFTLLAGVASDGKR